MNNSAYHVEIANEFIARERATAIKALYGEIQPFWGGSFWMVKAAK